MLKIIYIYLKWEPLQIALNSLLQRWKEQYFVNVGTDCGLTIAGFYYICFSCSDGSISGFYYDPNSRCSPLLFPIGLLWSQFFSLNLSKLFISLMHVLIRSFSIFLLLHFFIISFESFWHDNSWTLCSPYQKLELKSTNDGRSGFSFSSYELQ